MKRVIRKEFYLEDGTRLYFYNLKFEQVIKEQLQIFKDKGNKKSKQELLEDIQEVTGVSASSMNHWIMGHNAPGDVKSIKLVADFFHLDIRHILDNANENNKTDNRKGGKNMNTNNIVKSYDEKMLVREIYEGIVDFVEKFRTTLGFEYDDYGQSMEESIEANAMYNGIVSKIRKCMLDIPYELYNKLLAFTEGYLDNLTGDYMCEIWDIGTLSNAELKEQGADVDKRNQYSMRFIGYITFCEEHQYCGEDWMSKIMYVEYVSSEAYKIITEILGEYLVK